MIYQVITTRRALADMDKIHLYISSELFAKQAADELLNEIERQILELKQMPKRYALVSDERLAQLGYRAVAVKNYLVFYTINEPAQTVTIIRVLYGARDWAHLL
jgi:addiction module RelE/StbE family toxin